MHYLTRSSVATLLFGLLLAGCASSGTPVSAAPVSIAPVSTTHAPIGHVFLIVLENKPFNVTFGPESPAPYLGHTLPEAGALLTHYYATGHFSLDNYIALISGQAPNRDTQEDCHLYSEFVATTGKLDANGQLAGSGCIYPTVVKTVANQLSDAGLSWKGYMEDMGNDPMREAAQCGHAVIGSPDWTNTATPKDRYADKHNPFAYFHSIIDDSAYCKQHVVPLNKLEADLQQVVTTPNYSFITPNLCHDGHNAPCVNGEPGGLVSADKFLRTWVPRVMASPAFRKDGVLIITFDESDAADTIACCDEKALPGGPLPGRHGPGGGRVGAVVLSPFIKPGTVSSSPYNHYSALRSVEQWFGLPYLGYAQAESVPVFGPDVFTAWWPAEPDSRKKAKN